MAFAVRRQLNGILSAQYLQSQLTVPAEQPIISKTFAWTLDTKRYIFTYILMKHYMGYRVKTGIVAYIISKRQNISIYFKIPYIMEILFEGTT